MNWQQHNAMTSRWTRKRAFLQRKLDQHQHALYHPRTRRQHERMTEHYRSELRAMGAA